MVGWAAAESGEVDSAAAEAVAAVSEEATVGEAMVVAASAVAQVQAMAEA